jgi:lipid II:glycine glycyltransferase (peptidoglycan interpeptide bridge formation enzyme)
MEIKIINNQKEWDGWLSQNQQAGIFPQSWFWGEILQEEGKNIERLAIVENEETIAQAQVVYHNLPFGWKYAFCPKGYILKISKQFLIFNESIYQAITEYLKNKKCIFFRFEPNNVKYLMHDTKKTININPRATVVLDLSKTEEELLGGMHQKTRYNIKLAEKKDLRVENKKDLESFVSLSQKTGARDGFKLHDQKHYNLVISSSTTYQLNILKQNKLLAIGIFIACGDTFTYLYGASDYQYRQFMAPYLLQWEGIKLAKQMGYKFYDFFGIAPSLSLKHKNTRALKQDNYEYDKKHQYAGITRFKIGFGGIIKESPGTFDIVLLSFNYNIYKILRKINRLINLIQTHK